jgi:DMSO/TMAO reductase YedYZ heme-binding membrane subunit
MAPRKGLLEGWPLVAVGTAIVLIAAASSLALRGLGEVGIRAAIRVTATTSLGFFLAAFVASSVCSLRPSAATKWLLRNRRQLGVSFGCSQLAHLVLIGVLMSTHGGSFWRRVALTTLGGGGAGYVLTAALVVTSFDRTTAWLGRSRWRRLHLTGMYAFFGIFLFTYVPASTRHLHYAFYAALLLAALGLRIAAWRRRRRGS